MIKQCGSFIGNKCANLIARWRSNTTSASGHGEATVQPGA